MHRLWTVYLTLLLLTGSADSQESSKASSDWYYQSWQTEDGLPSNSIAALTQTSDGYLWLGTNGLIRFNGHDFTTIQLQSELELPSREVRAMFQDRKGRLWLGMERGPLLKLGEDEFRVFDQKDGLPARRVHSITDDSKGRIWLTHYNSVSRIEGELIVNIPMPRSDNPQVACDKNSDIWLTNRNRLMRYSEGSFEEVQSFSKPRTKLFITPSQDGGIWCSADNQLFLVDERARLVPQIKLPEKSQINSLLEDGSGTVWIATQRHGLYRFVNNALTSVPTSHPTVTAITADHQGYIWVGTFGGGLNVIKPRTVRLIEKSHGLPFASVQSLAVDQSGKQWAVGQAGQLAFQDSGGWQLFHPPEPLVHFLCVTADHDGTVWAGSRNHGLFKITTEEVEIFGLEQGLKSPNIRSLLVAANGELWVGGDNPYQVYCQKNGMFQPMNYQGSLQAVRALTQTADGTVWAGTSEGRLLRVQENDLVDETLAEGTSLISIRTLHATSDGSLWIGYAGDGLGHLKDGSYQRLTTEEGLPDNYLSQIKNDNYGNLWIAGNRGLFKVGISDLLDQQHRSPKALPLRTFGRNDGLPAIQPNRDNAPSSTVDSSGNLYFGTRNGILKVEPDQYQENSNPPPVLLERVSVDGQLVGFYHKRDIRGLTAQHEEEVDLSSPTPRLLLPPDHDRLTIEFAALSMASQENVKIRYRLKGLNNSWEISDNQYSAQFTRLSAGKYDFELIAAHSNGQWSKEKATLQIVVSPFFWETWWFKLAMGALTALAAGGLVFLGLRRRHRLTLRKIRTKRALEQERSRIARDIHDDLGASLTRISLLAQPAIEPKDEATKTKLGQIHTTARHLMRSMDGVVWAIDPEHDTIDDLASYLSSYAQDYLAAAEIACRIRMPLVLPEHSLSAQLRHNLLLVFKEALNNVVKYAQATEVKVTLEVEADELLLKVEDNGGGIDPEAESDPLRPASGRGLENMETRMKEIGGKCLLSSSSAGTKAEFHVPLRPAD